MSEGRADGIANARMYAVSPAAEAAWRTLIEQVAAEAGLAFEYQPYPAPQPLEVLWRRPDLGCVQMCGFPIATGLAVVQPIAAPIPDVPWAEGRAAYRSDLIVRADSPARTLADTFGGTLGWTVEHSHSGFNALRHHLLTRRPPGRATAYAATRGPLVTARGILEGVLDGSLTVGPLDAYWHLLIRRDQPDLLSGIRVIDVTDSAPMPAFVMAAGRPAEHRDRLAAAFAAAASRPWFPPLGAALCLRGFEPVTVQTYAPTHAWDRAAREAGYPVPA